MKTPYLLRQFSLLAVAFTCTVLVRADYYVARDAVGTGSGTSAANAANYQNMTFWNSTVQPALSSGPVTVQFANGSYDKTPLASPYHEAGLDLRMLGHPLNRLTLHATNARLAIFKAPAAGTTAVHLLRLYCSQNIEVDGLAFTAPASPKLDDLQSALSLSPGTLTPPLASTRNIVINNCDFSNVERLKYGAIMFGFNRDVTISDCDFTNVTGLNPPQVHAIYAGTFSSNILVELCTFTNIGGESVRFRSDSEYAKVSNNIFTSTNLACNMPFITVPLFNSVSPYANEFFGGHFEFTGNTFTYTVTSDNPGYYRFAHYFYNSGYNTAPGDGLDYMVDTTEAATLNGTNVPNKNGILANEMGLSNGSIHITNETYHGVVWATAYRGYGAGAQSYTTPANISDWPGSGTLAQPPFLRNSGFDFPNDRLRCWRTFSGNAPVDHPAINGGTKAIRLSSASNSQFGQWVGWPKVGSSDPTGINFTIALGSSPNPSGVQFRAMVYHDETAGSRLEVAVDSQGRIGYMNGSTFVALTGAVIAKSVDANANGTYSDAGDTLNVYRIKITINYAQASPSYSIQYSPGITGSYTTAGSGLTTWIGGNPVNGSKPQLLTFANTGANVVIDNVW
jgi:hypothetical protein